MGSASGRQKKRSDDLSTPFQPFARIRQEGGKAKEGTGLGLYLSMKIAHLLEGTISVRSEPGAGSDFTFSFPADSRVTKKV